MGYLFNEARSVKDKSIEWQAAKLAEETGEVCQAILHDCRYYDDIVQECIDVIQVAENIIRKLGYTDLEFTDQCGVHDRKMIFRNLYA